LVGAPPGYVGYEEGGQLTEQWWSRNRFIGTQNQLQEHLDYHDHKPWG
jgi:hypothetical protein